MSLTIDDADVATLKAMAQKYGLCETTPTPPNPSTSRPGLLYGYYGGGVVSEFADHCNFLHIGSWGDWITPEGRNVITNYVISQILDAVGRGITKTMITMDWCLFTPGWQPLPLAIAQQYVIKFVDALTNANVSQYVHAIYTVDEPDVQELSEVQVSNANSIIRDVCFHYSLLRGKPLVTTYGVNGTPGLHSFDWVGFDNYGTPIFTNGEFDAFVAKTLPTQKLIIVPGGANPWQDNPAPFNAKAQSDIRIALIMPFIWQDLPENLGIRSNGMAPQYKAVGAPIKAANP